MKTLSNSRTLFNKSIVVATLAATLTSGAVFAHDSSCNVELDTGFRIDKSTIAFLDKHDETIYKIVDNNELIVQGEAVELNDSQQQLVNEYSTSIRAMVPEIQSIAIEGVDLAVTGVNLAFNELLGEGNDIATELTRELTLVREDVSTKFSEEHGFTIGENGINDGEFFGEEFEERIESVVEKAVMNSMGTLLVAVGQEMLFSGGDTDAFEARMENFGENIEHQMEARAEKIEEKAEALCDSALAIDMLEEKMKLSIDELSTINVISTNSNNHDAHDKKDEQLM
ncbi:DUF2884 family protein [Litorilituus lipolyticus]|uniref:DUF2884 family protein n=1 Tax=Litorilituus lipolyticus TaxID=2491017 RepID=A0A502L593_9GAMM|nr:DUF2884 family protein [Litorilituus lipolyticus]TPH17203.1 DUF2884 family protein [Litorilituus lipolyticus]